MFILTRFKMCQDVEKVPIIKSPIWVQVQHILRYFPSLIASKPLLLLHFICHPINALPSVQRRLFVGPAERKCLAISAFSHRSFRGGGIFCFVCLFN